MKGLHVKDTEQHLIALCNLVGKDVGQIIKELPADSMTSYQEMREALNKKFLHNKT